MKEEVDSIKKMDSRSELERKLIFYITKMNHLKEQTLELNLEHLDFYELWEQYLNVLEIPREYFDLYLQQWLDKRFSRNQICEKSEIEDYMLEIDIFNPSLVYVGVSGILSDEAMACREKIGEYDDEISDIEKSLADPRSWMTASDLRDDIREINNKRFLEGQYLSRVRKLSATCDEGLNKINKEANS